MTDDESAADIIIVNTCCFINDAKEESVNTILEMAEYKKNGICRALLVTGCLAQRYQKEIREEIPEVDAVLGTNSYNDIAHALHTVLDGSKYENFHTLEGLPSVKSRRSITTGGHFAYLKIAEGCSNRCTYCAIPNIRGPFVSRKIEDILKEAKELANKGIKELIVIAQDTTKYGIDIYGEPKLAELLDRLCKIEGIEWVRFLYSYPETITEELIKVVKNNDKICKYFDIPIQHISNTVLKRMNRKSNEETIKDLMKNIRKEIPEVILRTTVIVGFPGETTEDFNKLYEFIKETKFDKLGAFMYSKEDGTPAARLKEQIHPQTKKSRYNKIMKVQQEISKNNLESKIGKVYKTLIEGVSFDGKYYIGRTYMDVPDMDGVVFIENENKTKDKIGEFVNCKITEVRDYDLVGKFEEN